MSGCGDRRLAARAVDAGIAKYGVAYDFACNGTIYDDANIASLLAAPLVSNLSIDDPLYTRTGACALSKNNAHY